MSFLITEFCHRFVSVHHFFTGKCLSHMIFNFGKEFIFMGGLFLCLFVRMFQTNYRPNCDETCWKDVVWAEEEPVKCLELICIFAY